MRRLLPALAPFLLLALTGCGPNTGSDGQGGPDASPDVDPGDLATIRGTVWAPGNAPGMVPAGHEIPVSEAHVYLSSTQPPPIPQEAHCDACTQVGGLFTNARGEFALGSVVPGTYWLVIQKGQFRRERQITVAAGETIELSAAESALPSVHDPQGGTWVPRIALASGIFDDMQDILGKMGLGEVDASGKFVAASAAGNFDVYSNGGDIDGVALGSLATLVSSLDTMLRYHIIFIPCAGSLHTAALNNQDVLMNIRQYVAAGGKLYVTDWSGEWADNVFPAQITFDDGIFGSVDTPAAAWDATNQVWNTSMFGDADGSPSYTSEHAEAIDPDLYAWLDGQRGPLARGGEGTFAASDFVITGNWNHIEELTTVVVGTDDDGNPVEDVPRTYIIGDDGLPGGKKPLTVTFEPVGCGRVLYSTYHTTEGTHAGLVPQERALLYLIMEIGLCKQGPIID
jgi:hypothetical protein